ncbi:unnamed protein product [Ixodes pacificus]
MKKHDHHILGQSPWPVLLSLCVLLFAFGMVGLVRGDVYGFTLVPASASLIVFVLYKWWKDVVVEAIRDRCFTDVVKRGLRMGMTVLIVSETMFFIGFFWSFFKAWLYPAYNLIDFSEKIHFSWPPKGLKTIDPWSLPLMNTVTLLLSGCTVTWSHYLLLENKIKESSKLLFFTVILGSIFSLFQAIEYIHASFPFRETGEKAIYSSNFYMATGFHGLHVILGVLFLLVCLVRMRKGQISAECHVGFEFSVWYWHFVDVVWLFLFLFMYIISS